MPYNAYTSVASTSLSTSGSTIAEERIPLWVYSSGSATAGGTGSFVQKGSTTTVTASSSATTLHTLSTKWPQSQKFAFEASIYSVNLSYTVTASLWDFTANAVVASSSVSTSAISMTLLRSSSFTLTPGHSYGIQLTETNGTTYISKAHLIALTM